MQNLMATRAASIDPRNWSDYLLRAYAEYMPSVGLTNPELRNPRNDEWGRYLTDEKKHATRGEYRHLLCYRVCTAFAHAALTDAVATLRAQNASATRDAGDANDLIDSAKPMALHLRQRLASLLNALGLRRNPKKGFWKPCQFGRHLGVDINPASGMFYAQTNKLDRLSRQAIQLIGRALTRNARWLPVR
eukprot:jgi/Tetstr1/445767/TSEL_033415.t1